MNPRRSRASLKAGSTSLLAHKSNSGRASVAPWITVLPGSPDKASAVLPTRTRIRRGRSERTTPSSATVGDTLVTAI